MRASSPLYLKQKSWGKGGALSFSLQDSLLTGPMLGRERIRMASRVRPICEPDWGQSTSLVLLTGDVHAPSLSWPTFTAQLLH